MTEIGGIIAFWFSDRARPLWFAKDEAFDQEIRTRFGRLVHEAQLGGFEDWRHSAEGSLALLILLDQMARNIHRGEAKAFLGDRRAREIADEAIGRGFDRNFGFQERRFFYLPFEHAEDMAGQDRAIVLFSALVEDSRPDERKQTEEQLHYAHLHRDIIRRFGRFPHRNEALGRPTLPEEAEFLKSPNSSF